MLQPHHAFEAQLLDLTFNVFGGFRQNIGQQCIRTANEGVQTSPTLVERRTNAQLIEFAVAVARVMTPSSSSALTGAWSGGSFGNRAGTGQGSVPSTRSLGE